MNNEMLAVTQHGALADADLLTRSRRGDERAYAELYSRHREAAFAAARCLTRSSNDAHDLVAEAFAKVLETLRRGGGPEVALRPYLLTTIRNLFYDRSRKAQRETVVADVPESPQLGGVDIVETALAMTAFKSLPERWQLVIWHTEVERQPASEVAVLLGIAPNAVAALAYRAREGLRQAFLQAHLAVGVPEQCQFTHDHLGAYVRDGLGDRDRGKLDSHLTQCERCRTVLAELRDEGTRLRGLLIPAIVGVSAGDYLHLLGGASWWSLTTLFRLFRRATVTQQALSTAAAVTIAGVVAVGGVGIATGLSGADNRSIAAPADVSRAQQSAGPSSQPPVTRASSTVTTLVATPTQVLTTQVAAVTTTTNSASSQVSGGASRSTGANSRTASTLPNPTTPPTSDGISTTRVTTGTSPTTTPQQPTTTVTAPTTTVTTSSPTTPPDRPSSFAVSVELVGRAEPGARATVLVHVVNLGPDDAAAPHITFRLPPGVSAGVTNGSAWTCSGEPVLECDGPPLKLLHRSTFTVAATMS